MKKDIVLIKKEECMSCHYLFSGCETKHPCHKEKDCPAKFYEVVVGLPMLQTAKRLSKAFANNDMKKIWNIMKRLERTHPTVKDNILNKTKHFMKQHEAS